MKALRLPVKAVSSLFVFVVACSSNNGESDRPSPELSAGGGSETSAGTPSEASAGSSGADAMSGRSGGGAGPVEMMTAGGGSGSSDEVYAHVTAVSTSGSAEAYRFEVSIESADIDCTQYADWWEVLSEDGALLYRRILEHSHTDENGTSDPDAPGNTFTRDGGPVPIAADTSVIVRAHMNNGGYNGRAMRGSAEKGFADAIDLEPDFAADVESEAPQPAGCAF